MTDFWASILIAAAVGVGVPLLWYLPWFVWGIWDDLTQPTPKQLRKHGELIARGFAAGADVAERSSPPM